ncbi:DUF1109 domain-containing protein [Aurantiacibacter sp. MUD11]|uniref:DUF1109 domain-containing protein n=1 Tax=Aurantiacibacter sp. MUD11 TaxID=3003265 RepID=UPI0022AAD081|nr:DUF1109 domain-containing protein [Aurantiacibacter sp. MUD11]WAT18153.1 DUF1109 domain-containing protein [Aurantiacibacter sp. MUD11]
MTPTETLIDRLSENGATENGHPVRQFVAPLLAVIVLCALGVALVLEGAFAPVAEFGIMPLTVKWGFSIALVVMSATTLWLLGQPGRKTRSAMVTLAIPFVLVGLLLVLDLLVARSTFPGATWRTCLAAMAIMSPLGFAGAVVATRWLAPTNLRRAGLAAGIFGGSVAMTAYSPYCPELGMLYMAVFYCLPILAMAGLGWLLGPRLLRW